MPQLRTLPALLARITPLTRLIRPGADPQLQRRAIAGLGLLLLASFALSLSLAAGEEGIALSHAVQHYLDETWMNMTWLPSLLDQALGGMLGPHGIILATAMLFLLPAALWALLILQELGQP